MRGSSGQQPFPMPSERYDFTKILGSGSYGTVQSWKDKEANIGVAVKRIPNAFDDFLITRRTLREIKLMTHFNHQNIISLIDVFMLDAEKVDAEKQKRNNNWNYPTPTRDLYMLTDLMDYDLDQMIRSRRADISSRHVRSFTCQILMGLKFLHAAHVIHRDLKPANIFVRRDGQVKLGDLGLARAIDLDGDGDPLYPTGEALTEYVVTRWYRAPEILVLRGCYGPPCDIWSVGCILYEIIMKDILFPGKGGYDQCSRILQCVGLFPDCSWLTANIDPPENASRKRTKMSSEAATHARDVIHKISSDILDAIPHAYNNRTANKSAPQKKSSFFGVASSKSSDATTTTNSSSNYDRIQFGNPNTAGRIDVNQRDLIEKMLQFNPNKRISVDEALQHTYFQEYRRNVEECLTQATRVDKIDMSYDVEYDNRASDSKNIPSEFRCRLRDQLVVQTEKFRSKHNVTVADMNIDKAAAHEHLSTTSTTSSSRRNSANAAVAEAKRLQKKQHSFNNSADVSPVNSEMSSHSTMAASNTMNSTKTYASSEASHSRSSSVQRDQYHHHDSHHGSQQQQQQQHYSASGSQHQSSSTRRGGPNYNNLEDGTTSAGNAGNAANTNNTTSTSASSFIKSAPRLFVGKSLGGLVGLDRMRNQQLKMKSQPVADDVDRKPSKQTTPY